MGVIFGKIRIRMVIIKIIGILIGMLGIVGFFVNFFRRVESRIVWFIVNSVWKDKNDRVGEGGAIVIEIIVSFRICKYVGFWRIWVNLEMIRRIKLKVRYFWGGVDSIVVKNRKFYYYEIMFIFWSV